MATQTPPAQPAAEDHVLKNLHELANDAAAANKAFQRKLATGTFADPAALASEVSDALSLFADLALFTATAHNEHYEWSEGVDDKIEELEEQLSPESALMPGDASRLKETILALLNAIPPSADESALLKARAEEAITFIDSVTIEETEGDEDEGDDEDEEAET